MRAPLTRRRLLVTLSLLAALTAIVALGAALLGQDLVDPVKALGEPGSLDARLLWEHRLPRVLNGLLVGAILAASGAALQGLLRNPLADPFILGVSGGAALGAATVALAGVPLVVGEAGGGFVGAAVTLFGITALASRSGRLRPLDLLLIGVIFNAVAGATLTLLQALADADAVYRVLMRLMGTLAVDPTRPLLLPLLGIGAVVLLLTLARHARSLDLLALGDETAASLGVRPERLRRVLFVVLSLAIGAVVAITGLIGFVGLIVPHAVRLVVGPDHRLLVPASAFVGAAFLALMDALVRTLAGPLGTELPVGVATAVIGGPMFVWLLRRQREVRG